MKAEKLLCTCNFPHTNCTLNATQLWGQLGIVAGKLVSTQTIRNRFLWFWYHWSEDQWYLCAPIIAEYKTYNRLWMEKHSQSKYVTNVLLESDDKPIDDTKFLKVLESYKRWRTRIWKVKKKEWFAYKFIVQNFFNKIINVWSKTCYKSLRLLVHACLENCTS